MDRRTPVDLARPERLDAVKRWYAQDWLTIDAKLRSSIIEGLSVFLSVFDLPDVAATFCPPKPTPEQAGSPAPADAGTAGAQAADTAAVTRPLPPLDDVIDSSKVLCLNMAAGTNPASRAVGVLLKQAWLQTLLRRAAEIREWRCPCMVRNMASPRGCTRRRVRRESPQPLTAATPTRARPATARSRRQGTGQPRREGGSILCVEQRQ